MMGYLVAQGLVVALLIDAGISALLNEKSFVRSACQLAGYWKDIPAFEDSHGISSPQSKG